jgi:hypothetical protein
MEKENRNNEYSVNFLELALLLKRALEIYVNEGQERRIENEEYELYKEQYPFDEYYHFKEEFKCEWE